MSDFIQFNQVSRWFESASVRFDALKNIDLHIEQGKHVAIVGKSGSGKSTLLNMLTGIDHPSQGTVKINSTDVHTLNESRLAEWRGKNVGIVFQFFQLIPTLTIVENILLAMDFVNVIPARERTKRASKMSPHAFQHRMGQSSSRLMRGLQAPLAGVPQLVAVPENS